MDDNKRLEALHTQLEVENANLKEEQSRALKCKAEITKLEQKLEDMRARYKEFVGTPWRASGTIELSRNRIASINSQIENIQKWQNAKEGVWLTEDENHARYRFTKTTPKRIYYISRYPNYNFEDKGYTYNEGWVDKYKKGYPLEELDWKQTLSLFE